jgi:hypothetical protein
VKTCTRCGKKKPLEMFPRHARKRDGHGARCLDCKNAEQRALRATPEGREAANIAARAYYRRRAADRPAVA